ncbi:MAG: putative Fe-S oxidoreductase [Patescibacteria group bacterium]|nr:putative Fe-S oxidoreductase [Patescibacteria group bacterium]
MSIEKEGDASSAGAHLNVSEEQIALRTKQLDAILGEPPEISMEEVLHSYEVTASKGATPAKAAKPSKLNMKKRTHGEKKAAAKKTATSGSYEGDPHYGVPAVTGDFLETRKDRHDALREALARSQEQTSSKVIALPDQSEELAAPASDEATENLNQTQEDLRAVKSRLEARKSHVEYINAKIEAVEQLKYEKLQEFHKKRSALGRIAEQYTGELLPKEIKSLMATSVELRGAYLKETIGTVEERRAARKRDENKNEAVRERYQRRYEFERRMLIEPEEREIQARIEGLGSREKKALDTLFDRYKELPAPWRILGTSGVMLAGGVAIGAGLGTGVGLTALAIGGMSAATRLASLYQENKTVKGALEKAARLTGIGGIVGLALESAVHFGHDKSGTEKKAQALLQRGAKIDKDKTLNLGNLNIFKKLLADRKKAKTAKERIEIQARWARSLGSLGAGLATGHLISGVFNDGDTELTSGGVENPTDTTVHAPRTVADSANTTETPSPAEAPRAPVAEVKAEPITATIDAGEGFNRLFLDLRDSADTRLHGMQDVSSSSPVMEYLFTASPSELSERIGAFDPETGKSMIMQPGDKLFLDDKGDLWFQKVGGEAKLLMENDATAPGGFKVHDLPEIQIPETPLLVATQDQVAKTESDPTPIAAEATIEPVETTEIPYVSEGSAPIELGTDESIASASPESNPQDVEALIPRANLGSMNVDANPQAPAGVLRTQSLDSWVETSIEADTHSFSNAYGVEINPSEPAGYEWRVPGSNATFTVAFGEDAAATESWALRELELHPESRVLVNYTEVNPRTGALETTVGAWQIGTDGTPELLREVTNPENGQRLVAVDPQDFIRKLP